MSKYTIYPRCWYHAKIDGWSKLNFDTAEKIYSFIKGWKLYCHEIKGEIMFVKNETVEPDYKQIFFIIKNNQNNEIFTGNYEDLENWLRGKTKNQVTIS